MNPNQAESTFELRDYLRVLRRRGWVIVLMTLTTVGGAVTFLTLQTPMYAATAELLLQPRGSEVIVGEQQVDARRGVPTEIQVITSRAVHERVLRAVPNAPRVKASPIGETVVVALRVESPNPELSQRTANAYAHAYIEHRRERDVEDLTAAIGKIDEQLAEVTAQANQADASEKAGLERTRASLQEMRQELLLSTKLKTGGAQIVSEALVPTAPFAPNVFRRTLLAFFLGTLLGVGLAFLLEYLDDSIRGKGDLERATGGLPVLGLIPAVAGWKSREETRLVSLKEPNARPAEAYRTLRTAVQFLSIDQPVRVIHVTSANAEEGKSTTVANLGVALARAGRHVVIVCCDLRRPRLYQFFGLSNVVGFTSVLLGETSLSSALQPVPGVDRLSLVASGPVPPNPSELLSARRTGEMFESLRAEGRTVLIDSPPVLPVTDSLVLARWADATLLVSSAGRTSGKQAARAVELLQQVGAPLVGTVLNQVKADDDHKYGYYYGRYGYQEIPAGRGANGNGAETVAGGRRKVRRR